MYISSGGSLAGLGCSWTAVPVVLSGWVPAVALLPDEGAGHGGELGLAGAVGEVNTNCDTAGTVGGADLHCSEDKHWWERLDMHFL